MSGLESIGEILANYHPGITTHGQNNSELDEQALIRCAKEQLRLSIGVSSLEHTFKAFEPKSGTETSLQAFKALAEGTAKQPMLLCYGGTGNGKTHLCEAAIIELRKRGIFCRYLTMAKIMRALKTSMNREFMVGFDDLIERYCHALALVVDDVGMGGSGSDWEYGQLEEIVNERYREKLVTIMATNKDIKDLPERIISRFSDPEVGVIVLNEGADYRRRRS